MLQHSSLDDIEYSNYSQSTRLSIKNRQRSTRRHRHHHKSRRNKNRNRSKFVIDTCAVCLDESSCSDTKLFPCGHSFHGKCLIQWVKASKGRKFNCPLCRQDIAHFIQMTGNQELNDELIQIWNEHYLYNQPADIADDTTTIIDKDACCDGLEKASSCTKSGCCSKASSCDTSSCCVKASNCNKLDCSTTTKTIECPKEQQQQEIIEIVPDIDTMIIKQDSVKIDPITVPPKVEPVIEVDTVKQNVKVNEIENKVINASKSDHSIWKFIWKSPISTLCKQNNGLYATFMMINSLLFPVYDTNVTYHDVDNVDNKQHDLLLHPLYNKQSVHQQSFKEQHLHSTLWNEQQIEQQLHYQQMTTNESTTNYNKHKHDDHGSNNNNYPYQYIDLLSSSIINFKSGVLAGLCAGTTTYLLTQQIRHEIVGQVNKSFINNSFRTSLVPILTETVPSVAVFFTSYEHLKKYLFNIDNINNTNSTTFAQRFISAGMASSLAYYLPNMNKHNPSKGLLPFRFAAFFGTFELCKDLINKRHEELNLPQVAVSAAIGGTVSHSLYHPLLQYKNIFVVGVDTVPWINLTATATSTSSLTMKTMYRGWMSSLSKFLPSCIVCSCAFEYSKRYLSK